MPCGPYPAVCTDWRRLQLGGLLDPAHGKGNAAALLVHLQHLYPDNVPHFQHLAGVLYIFFAQLADVYQAILMHTDIHKGAKIHHIADSAGQFHFRF